MLLTSSRIRSLSSNIHCSAQCIHTKTKCISAGHFNLGCSFPKSVHVLPLGKDFPLLCLLGVTMSLVCCVSWFNDSSCFQAWYAWSFSGFECPLLFPYCLTLSLSNMLLLFREVSRSWVAKCVIMYAHYKFCSSFIAPYLQLFVRDAIHHNVLFGHLPLEPISMLIHIWHFEMVIEFL